MRGRIWWSSRRCRIPSRPRPWSGSGSRIWPRPPPRPSAWSGPLVSPGRSACLRCLDLTRAERDPAWPLILAQVAGSRLEPQACDTVLAAGVAALAAAQVLLFIDTGRPGRGGPNGTLELAVPDWQWRRRTWLAAPALHVRRGRRDAAMTDN